MALAGEVLTLDALASYAHARAGWRHAARAIDPLAWVREGFRSPREALLFLLWRCDAGLPEPLINRPIFDLEGNFIACPDIFEEHPGFVLEYDGEEHRGIARHAHDVDREEACRQIGLEYAKVVGPDMADPAKVVRGLAAMVVTLSSCSLDGSIGLQGDRDALGVCRSAAVRSRSGCRVPERAADPVTQAGAPGSPACSWRFIPESSSSSSSTGLASGLSSVGRRSSGSWSSEICDGSSEPGKPEEPEESSELSPSVLPVAVEPSSGSCCVGAVSPSADSAVWGFSSPGVLESVMGGVYPGPSRWERRI
jgi:hypothetical protein